MSQSQNGDNVEFGPEVPRLTTYEMTSRLVGPGYPEGGTYPRRRTLTVLRNGMDMPALTLDEATEAVKAFVARPFVNATVEVMRVTKVTTATVYEDVTEQTQTGRTADPKQTS